MIEANCCCGCTIPTIVVWNNDSILEDNLKVVLNGIDIGHIDNSTPTYTGRIFSSDTAVNATNHPGGPFGFPPNFQSTLLLDTSLLITGHLSNTLRLESIQDNGGGNPTQGRILIQCLAGDHANGYTLQTPASPLLDINYFFSRGLGNGQNFHFSYPRL